MFYGLVSRKFFTVFLLIIPISLGLIFSLFLSPEIVQAGQTMTITVTVTNCGNNIQETGEECDGSVPAGQTCISKGYTGGTLSCNTNCALNTSSCTSGNGGDGGGGGGGGGGGWIPPETKVVFQGKAYPNTEITILKDGQIATKITADFQANFEAALTNLTAGTYTFSLWAKDAKGRKSIAFSFTVKVSSGVITTISGIFIPPTIELAEVGVVKGETLNILGQTAPTSEVTIRINSPTLTKQTMADYKGDWGYALDTSSLDEGSHFVSAKAVYSDDFTSSYSNTLGFYIGQEVAPLVPGPGKIKSAELNKDDRINIIDFSILLYNWGTPKNTQADLNNDGRVNLVDFSILMYQWTG